MKKPYLLLAAAALLVGACTQENTVPAPETSAPLRLVVGIRGTETRATGVVSNSSDSEAKVNDLQIFVFNGNSLDGRAHAENAMTATVSCTSGVRDIIAVVNAPDLSAITSKPDLMAQVATLSNDPANFQMIGQKTEVLRLDGTVEIPVNRLAARIVLKGVKNALSNSAQASSFRLRAVYLTNVAGDVDFAGSSSYTVSRWYNQRGYQAANNLGNFTYDAINETVASGSTYTSAHYFYAMPNAKAAAVGGPWTPRATRLVIQAEMAGVVYDYPILLPALESNKSYEIDLVTLSRPGNPDDGIEPDDARPGDVDEENPVVGFDQQLRIVVNPWTVVPVTEGTTI